MPQIDDVFALLLLLVDAARIWISGTTERKNDGCDSDITCPGGNISLLAGNQLLSLSSAIIITFHAYRGLSWRVISEAAGLISIKFGVGGLH